MPVTQQQAVLTTDEAERFAALWAGFDTGNASEAEAMGKGRALRRMVAEKGLRLVDAFELPEIRAALDAQMQPARQASADMAALQAENESLREKLAEIVPEVTRLAEALTTQTELTARLNARLHGRQQGGFTGPLLSGVLFVALVFECVLAVIGLVDSRAIPRAAVLQRASIEAAPVKAPAIEPKTEIKPVTKRAFRRYAWPKTKPKPVPESQF